MLELLAQLRAVVLTGGLSYLVPLTQELIADVLGPNSPHVSRMLRLLRKKDWSPSRGHCLTMNGLGSLILLAVADLRAPHRLDRLRESQPIFGGGSRSPRQQHPVAAGDRTEDSNQAQAQHHPVEPLD